MKIIKWILAALTLLTTVIMLFIFPDTIPVHFDINGIADRWGSKYEMLIMPGTMLAMLVFWVGMDAWYNKSIKNHTDEKTLAEARSNQKVIRITSVITSLMFAVINGLTIFASYSQLEGSDVKEVDFLKILSIVMGISFILLGNFMPKAKNNSTVGFRLPWTRFNDVAWRKSNLVGGIAMLVQGVIMVVSGIVFRGEIAMVIMLVTLAVVLPFITIFAYVIYRQERDKCDDKKES